MPDILLKLPILDLFLLIGLMIGLFTGLHNGVIRKSFRIGVFLILGIVFYFSLVPFLTDFVEYNLLAELGVTIEIPIMGYTFVCYSIHDVVLICQNLNIDTALLASLSHNVCKAIVVIVLIAAVGILSIPITWILFDLVIRRFLSKKDESGKRIKYKPKAISRLLGCVVGILEWAILGYILSQSYATLTAGFNEVLLPQLSDSSSSLYSVLSSIVGEENIPIINSVLTIVNNSFNPQCSYILKYLYPTNQGIWMFKGVVVSVDENGDTIVKESSIQESFSQTYNQIIEAIKEVTSSMDSEDPSSGESSLSLLNI